MRRNLCALGVVVFLSTLGRSAIAGPITLNIRGDVFAVGPYDLPSMDVEGFDGGMIRLGDTTDLGPMGDVTGASRLDIDTSFSLALDFQCRDGGISSGAYLLLTGDLKGSLVKRQDAFQIVGGFTATVQDIRLVAESGSGIPDAVLNGFLDPERIHIRAVMTGGTRNRLLATMEIDPLGDGDPAVVPEPTALFSLAIGLGVMAFGGVRRHRRRQVALAAPAATS